MKLNSLQLQQHKYKLSSDSFKNENNNSIYIVSLIFIYGLFINISFKLRGVYVN